MPLAVIILRLNWGEGSASKHTHLAVTRRPQLLAVCRSEALIPNHMHLSIGLLECHHDMAAGLFQGD